MQKVCKFAYSSILKIYLNKHQWELWENVTLFLMFNWKILSEKNIHFQNRLIQSGKLMMRYWDIFLNKNKFKRVRLLQKPKKTSKQANICIWWITIKASRRDHRRVNRDRNLVSYRKQAWLPKLWAIVMCVPWHQLQICPVIPSQLLSEAHSFKEAWAWGLCLVPTEKYSPAVSSPTW